MPARLQTAARYLLFLFVTLVACPVRYWPVRRGLDPSWRFALNYLPAHGFAMGRDYIFTTGPLAWLMFPQHVANNLRDGLIFQFCLWIVMAIILADVFREDGFRLPNLALFSVFFGLAGPWFWVNAFGPENLILTGALLLIVLFHLRGGWIRYAAALVLIGLLPLFRLSAFPIGLAALAGFLAERCIQRRSKAWPELALAAVVPVTVAFCSLLFLLPSASSVFEFIRRGAEITAGFPAALATEGPSSELFLAVEALALLVALLWFGRGSPRFYLLFLAGPIFISLKHAFIRQDRHITNYFCFIALALGLIALVLRPGAQPRRVVIGFLTLCFCGVWEFTVGQHEMWGIQTHGQAIGTESVRMLAGLFPLSGLGDRLDAITAQYSQDTRIEPELLAIVGDSSIASLSFDFTSLIVAGVRPQYFPTIQRIVADTSSLDEWNARWVRDRGPRYLITNDKAPDNRALWAESPAIWREAYRWYDTRYLGVRNLLLERRATPRFMNLDSIGHLRVGLSDELRFPASDGPVFWTMKCAYSTTGTIRKALTRLPPVEMPRGGAESRRVIPELLAAPVMGNYLPANLADLAAIFRGGHGREIGAIRFAGEGITSYQSPCDVELFRPGR